MGILERFGVRATTFVITSCIGNRQMMWRHKLSAIQALVDETTWRRKYDEMALACNFRPITLAEDLLSASDGWDMQRKDEWASLLWRRCGLPPIAEYLDETRPYFDWKGLGRWLAAGHSVGFHTHTHPFCSRLAEMDLKDEFVQPALDLKQRLGIDQLSLSYPFGERLHPHLESLLVELGIFDALLGIGGFSRRGMPNESLRRACAEDDHIGWTVLRGALSARMTALRGRGSLPW
jgi:peptidoglycan/xylan/chitin deacetylase (PgdA/CDA1 family)